MDGLGSLMHHDMSMAGPNGQLPPLHASGLAASADPAVHALLERLNQLETYKNHLENENKQMHQQLQVLSGFLNVVSTSVRTTENMLFSSVPSAEPPHMQMAAEGSQMLSAVPSQSTVTAVAGGQLQAQTPTPTGMQQQHPQQQQQQQHQQQQQQHPQMMGNTSTQSLAGNGYNAPQQAPQAAMAPSGHAGNAQGNASSAAAAPASHPANAAQAAAGIPSANGNAPAGNDNSSSAAAAAKDAAPAAAAAAAAGYRCRSSQAELATMDGSTAAPAAAGPNTTGSRKRARAEPPPSPSPSMAAAAAAASSSAALAAAVAAAANYMPTQQQQQLAQMQQMQQMQQLMPMGLGGSEISLRLTKVQGKTILHGDPVMIYRVELSRNGVFEKYLFLPNDAIPIYGMRSWQHRDAIPQELLKMVENCLTTKAVASEQYIEEIKTMKAYMLQQCPHLARWGLGSNKVRLVTDNGMRDLVTRLHRTMQKHGTHILPKQLDVDLSWITSPEILQIPVQAWAAPVYSRRLQNAADEAYAAAAMANPYGGVPVLPGAGSSSGLGPTDNSPSASGITAAGMAGDMYQQQQMVPCGLPNMMPVMMHGGGSNGQQQQYNQMYYNTQQDMSVQQHGMLQQQGIGLPNMQQLQHQQSTALGSQSLLPVARQGSTAGDQGLGHNGYAPVTPGSLGPGALDGLHHGQGSRTDLQGTLLHHGSSTASAAAAADGVMGPTVMDPAAVASMPVLPEQQQQKQQPAEAADAGAATTAVAAVTKQHQQQQDAPAGPQKPPPQGQQPQQQSPGAAGSNGSTDSTMADAVAGLQALSRQQEESLQARTGQQQLQQCDGSKKATADVQPLRDQQQQQQPAPQGQQQQPPAGAVDATGSRQGSAPSPDAAAAMCAAATAIAVQQ